MGFSVVSRGFLAWWAGLALAAGGAGGAEFGLARVSQPAEKPAANPTAPPTPPRLPEDAAREVAELEGRIRDLIRTGLAAETRAAQDAAVDEAIGLAERVLAIRREHQGNTEQVVRWRDGAGAPAEWYEVADSRRKVEDLGLLRELESAARADLVSLVGTDADIERLYGEGRYAEALALLERQLTIRRGCFPGDHTGVAMALNNVAYMREALGRAGEAEPLFEEALAMCRRLFTGDHPQVALFLNNLAYVRRALGREGEAEPLFEEALAMQRHLFTGDHQDVATSLNNLALVRESLGRAGEAEPLFEEALAMRKRLFKGDHLDVAASLSNLAAVRKNLGRAGEAEPLFEEALAMRKRLFTGDHPDVARGLNSVAFVRMSLGRAGEAEPLYEEALAMRRRLFTGDHPEVAVSLNNLAIVRESLGRAGEAEPLFEEALAMRKRLFTGDHPDVAHGLNSVAFVRESLGRLGEAEPLYEEALAMRKRLFAGDHPDVAMNLSNLAYLRDALGRAGEAEPLYAEALGMAERMRIEVRGAAQERAVYAGRLGMAATAAAYARVLIKLERAETALSALERGRSRAGLDLLAGGRAEAERALRDIGDPQRAERYEQALDEEREASTSLFDAESRMAKAPENGKEASRETVNAARRVLSEKTSAVFNELRGLVPTVDPLTAEKILAALRPGEALLSYSWTGDGAVALVARDRKVVGLTLAKGNGEASKARAAIGVLRDRLARRPSLAEAIPDSVLAGARDAALSEKLRRVLAGVSMLTVIADGPLAGVPLELLMQGDPALASIPIAYAPSATIALRPRLAAEAPTAVAAVQSHNRALTGVIVGDPVFAGAESRPEPSYPDSGVLLAMVAEDGNAAQAGLKRGDVVLSYNGTPLAQNTDLKPAVDAVQALVTARGAETPAPTGAADVEAGAAVAVEPATERIIPAEVWRRTEDGGHETVMVHLAPGRLGVNLDPAPPAQGLRSMEFFDRSPDQQKAKITALEQIRLYGTGTLRALPATRLEASAVAAMLGADSTLLLGADATVPRLRETMEKTPPRVLHLATHGLMGNADRPLLSSLALSTPKEPTLNDIGFLTLEEILNTWGGSLKGNDLVVLSACDTAIGQQRGDTAMSLPLGFFVCGTRTVIASLWKVDDTATALLMSRFYANWLGKQQGTREIDGKTYAPSVPLPKLAALREARQWLRSLTISDRDRLIPSMDKATPEQIAEAATRGEPIPRRGAAGIPSTGAAGTPPGEARPYDHPYYWAAFVLYGSPE